MITIRTDLLKPQGRWRQLEQAACQRDRGGAGAEVRRGYPGPVRGRRGHGAAGRARSRERWEQRKTSVKLPRIC